MAVTLVSTGVQFPDSTIQTTAASGGVTSLNGQTGAITNTTQYAIGSYVMGRPIDYTHYNNSTIAGSSLYQMAGPLNYAQGGEAPYAWKIGGIGVGDTNGASPSANVAVLVNTGSWRCVSMATSVVFSSIYNVAGPGLWVRYA